MAQTVLTHSAVTAKRKGPPPAKRGAGLDFQY